MAQRHASKGSGLLSLVLALVLILAGLAVLLYPRVTNRPDRGESRCEAGIRFCCARDRDAC